ncbi:NADP-dependent malic enzyme [Paenimyroides aestuarii]|uniref:NADP-dependent malic enzyme n=1 Tax=Paenimyroides aestuarii TaxID=2968490 RepID=A0ABY5NT32_9FLAO|nr:NADP-dependent malic enzyme [Paenimyroides aestuarii]UUV21729.1 NADP-dependent malic enzyme [Paenimyroides aestuarii]
MHKDSKRREALLYHAKPKPGKIAVVPTKATSTQRDLALAYSPGVAEPCLEIEKNPENAYKYTAKGNLVAVISNGTAVLGLGDIGAQASKPVMEGKGLLFKIFADIDVFDIEVDTKNVDEFVNIVKALEPTFGGINLEDIKAPECFEIERRLKEEMNIPVMHDDQHGTAIISGAALINACELQNKQIKDVKIVVNGAGAAAISCTQMYISVGALKENIVMLDSKGVIRTDRENLDPSKAAWATNRDIHTLEDAMKDADVFIGLSAANVVTPEMLKTMAANPIVLAMANPNPEIAYELAMATRDDIIMGTGRSDFPNQVNNVLGFPFIFRGALDVRATKINEEMKLAAVYALAKLAKESVPEQVNIAYGERKLSFGKDYIIPKPFDPRLMTEIPPAVAKAAMESGVATESITNWEAYRDELSDRMGSDNKLVRMLMNRAKMNPKKVVYTEADQLNVLKAAQIAYEEGIAIPILLGNKEVILELKVEIGFDADVLIIDPKINEESERRKRYTEFFWKSRERRGITKIDAEKLMRDRSYFASMMVLQGEADAMLTGYSRSYPSALKPVLDLIPRVSGVSKVASTNLMLTRRGPMFLADTAVNPNPTSEEIAKIALMTNHTVKMFGLDPVVAMISYGNFGSSKEETPRKMRKAVEMLHENYPEMVVDGEIQIDFALNQEMLKDKFPFSKLVGKKVNTLVFPNLDTANTTYKMLKELNGATSIGPILLGLDAPVHVFQLGASVDEMVNMTAVAVIDAQQKSLKKKSV